MSQNHRLVLCAVSSLGGWAVHYIWQLPSGQYLGRGPTLAVNPLSATI